MAFSTFRPTQLLTLSYDGSLRCMDVEKAVFDEVRETPLLQLFCLFLQSRCLCLLQRKQFGSFLQVYSIDDGLKTFAFMSHDCSTLLVGNVYGEVSIVDRRTPG